MTQKRYAEIVARENPWSLPTSAGNRRDIMHVGVEHGINLHNEGFQLQLKLIPISLLWNGRLVAYALW